MERTLYNQRVWLDKFIPKEPSLPSEEERMRNVLGMIPTEVTMVLDVGVGGGYIFGSLQQRYAAGCFGMDISSELISRLKSRRTCVADAVNIPFKEGAFDIVLAADLLEHIREESFASVVSELARVSGKYILINSPYKGTVSWPVSLCNECGREFNIYGHIRSVDAGLIKKMFPADRFETVKIELLGKKRIPRPAFMVRIARRFGRVYSSEAAICPYCLNDRIKLPERNAFQVFVGRLISGAFIIMDKIVPLQFKCGSEICVLIKKI